MNLKNIWHLFKHGVDLRKYNYLYFLLTAGVLILYKVLSNFYRFPNFLSLMIPMLAMIGGFSLLISSALIPNVSKTAVKGQGGHYTWGYILSTVRFPKDLLFTYFLEIVFDSLLLAITLAIALPNLEWWIFCTVLNIGAVVIIRLSKLVGGLRGAKVRSSLNHQETKNIKYKTIFYGLVGFGILLVSSDELSSLIPPSLIEYLATPFAIGFILYTPFLIYNILTTDYNYQENSLYMKKILGAGGGIVLVSLVFFYNQEMKSGYIIFSEISEGNIERVEKSLQRYKDVLKLRGENTNLSPLLFAAKKNQAEIVKLILNNGGDINETDHIGNNLLTYTARNCNYNLSEYLVKKGINYNNMPSDNMNPLFTAASVNCLPLIKYFRKLKMEEGAVNKDKQNYIIFGSSQNEEFKLLYKFLFRNGLF